MRFLKISNEQYVNTDRIESVQVIPVGAGQDRKFEVQVRTVEEYYVAATVDTAQRAEIFAMELVSHLEGN